ncbi:MAG TPA: thiamine pyrophosphate-binding protein [Baekduia sp.]|nr:thiamine pyrophosphate-binding protein [Baekduia sp.]
MRATAGTLIVRSLELHGVEAVFGIPGTHNLAIYEALGASAIRHVTPRHEQGAGYAADGYARASGRPGVAVVTTGPAVLNAATAAAQAWSDSVPLLLLAPGMPLSHPTASTGYLHEAPDQRLTMSGAVERAVRVESHGELARELADAFGSFASERPRARFVEVPLDLLGIEASCTPLAAPAIGPRQVDPAAVVRAAELLSSARRPLVLAGGGAHGARAELAALLDRGLPVMTTINGKGAVDERHALAVGARLQVPAGRRMVEDADVLLVVGSDLGELHQWGSVRPAGRIIRADVDPAEAHGNVASDVALVGDARAAMSALLERLPPVVQHRDDGWRRLRAEADRELAELSRPWAGIATALESALTPGDVLCADNAMVAYNGLLGSVRLGAGSRFLFPSGFGTLGYALPAAIGAKLGRPDRRVVAVLGDGGIMFSLAELATAAALGSPLPVIVSVNGGYGEIRREMEAAGFPPLAVDLPAPDLPAVARALGGHGVALQGPETLGEALEAAFDRPGPTLITLPE